MCGIAGFVGVQPPRREDILQQMLAAIAHRGPDGEGRWFGPAVSLGHRRLAIIDPVGGGQPFFNEDATLAVVFNGEIYNHAALRAELEAAGHRFSSRCDTEVLVHGYEEWGDALPDRLRGMFAFALWDSRAQTLFCARDPFGIKPFYYYNQNGMLLFGSEIKCFLPHPGFAKRLNTAPLAAYLCCQYSPGEETFFAGVKKLPPAHWLRWTDGQLILRRYWQPVFRPGTGGSAEEWGLRLHTALRQSVQRHLLADVPVGSFLSSGIDSTYIAALSGVDHTFTVGFSDQRYSEVEQARASARQLGLQPHSRLLSAREYRDALGRVQYAMDEPLADASAPALYFLAEQAAGQVRVCLSGEGADELFGGYNVYTEPFSCGWYDRIPQPLRRAAGAAAELLPPAHGMNFLVRRSRPLAQRYIGPTCLMTHRQALRLLQPGLAGPPVTDLTGPLFAQAQGLGPVAQMQTVDLNLWLAGDILLKADRMSMAHGLEVRVPYLDREVFELASAIPEPLRADAARTKITLRQAAGQALPPALCARRKLGFPAPVRAWLQDPAWFAQVEHVFLSGSAARFFRPAALRQLLDWHRQGKADVWRQIWCVYSFLLWYEEYFCKR